MKQDIKHNTSNMGRQPLVSVIIPNYNHARYLDQRIQTVLNQTYQNFEVIILDDKSTDNSLEVIAKYKVNPHISQIVINEQNSGSPFK
ncbi:MAG: glycosyltransferase family A protein [Bacteroidia bacterium]|nr:glycosyltransferase family A protein [Bacteroidia bacterium]